MILFYQRQDPLWCLSVRQVFKYFIGYQFYMLHTFPECFAFLRFAEAFGQIQGVNTVFGNFRTHAESFRHEQIFLSPGFCFLHQSIHKFHLLVGCTADHVLYSPYV